MALRLDYVNLRRSPKKQNQNIYLEFDLFWKGQLLHI